MNWESWVSGDRVSNFAALILRYNIMGVNSISGKSVCSGAKGTGVGDNF